MAPNARKPPLPSGSRHRLPVLSFTFALTALLCAVTAPRVHAQTEESTNAWVTGGGTIEVSTNRLNIEEGEGLSYRIRLTKRLPFVNPDDPTEGRVGGWWVRVHVDGEVRADGYYDDNDEDSDPDIRWVPSVGWEFNPDDWPANEDIEESNWREFTVYGLSKLDRPVEFTHEVWDHDAYCPPKPARYRHGDG